MCGLHIHDRKHVVQDRVLINRYIKEGVRNAISIRRGEITGEDGSATPHQSPVGRSPLYGECSISSESPSEGISSSVAGAPSSPPGRSLFAALNQLIARAAHEQEQALKSGREQSVELTKKVIADLQNTLTKTERDLQKSRLEQEQLQLALKQEEAKLETEKLRMRDEVKNFEERCEKLQSFNEKSEREAQAELERVQMLADAKLTESLAQAWAQAAAERKTLQKTHATKILEAEAEAAHRAAELSAKGGELLSEQKRAAASRERSLREQATWCPGINMLCTCVGNAELAGQSEYVGRGGFSPDEVVDLLVGGHWGCSPDEVVEWFPETIRIEPTLCFSLSYSPSWGGGRHSEFRSHGQFSHGYTAHHVHASAREEFYRNQAEQLALGNGKLLEEKDAELLSFRERFETEKQAELEKVRSECLQKMEKNAKQVEAWRTKSEELGRRVASLAGEVAQLQRMEMEAALEKKKMEMEAKGLLQMKRESEQRLEAEKRVFGKIEGRYRAQLRRMAELLGAEVVVKEMGVEVVGLPARRVPRAGGAAEGSCSLGGAWGVREVSAEGSYSERLLSGGAVSGSSRGSSSSAAGGERGRSVSPTTAVFENRSSGPMRSGSSRLEQFSRSRSRGKDRRGVDAESQTSPPPSSSEGSPILDPHVSFARGPDDSPSLSSTRRALPAPSPLSSAHSLSSTNPFRVFDAHPDSFPEKMISLQEHKRRLFEKEAQLKTGQQKILERVETLLNAQKAVQGKFLTCRQQKKELEAKVKELGRELAREKNTVEVQTEDSSSSSAGSSSLSGSGGLGMSSVGVGTRTAAGVYLLGEDAVAPRPAKLTNLNPK